MISPWNLGICINTTPRHTTGYVCQNFRRLADIQRNQELRVSKIGPLETALKGIKLQEIVLLLAPKCRGDWCVLNGVRGKPMAIS
jgi:hypothetical protein